MLGWIWLALAKAGELLQQHCAERTLAWGGRRQEGQLVLGGLQCAIIPLLSFFMD